MRRRSVLARVTLAGGSLLVTVLLLELLLRSASVFWPPATYGSARFSPDLQLRVHGASTLYQGVRWTRRAPNRDGFLDVEHAREKPAGVTRVGFFGDSYVEALQVPLAETFFRQLPAAIAGRPVEALAFGISGWGTLHALMAYRAMAGRYGLDHVVYVFVKNDPGNNHYRVHRDNEPAAQISDDPMGFRIRMPQGYGESLAPWHRFLQRNVMLVRLIHVQLRVLRVQRERLRRARAAGGARLPDENDYPSAWPPEILEEAKLLTRRILQQFRDEVRRDGRRFSVLYVPRGNEELEGTLPPRDRWIGWLTETCKGLDIDVWDPTALLARQHDAGTTIYDDHWSPAGHALIAAFVAQQLADERPRDPE